MWELISIPWSFFTCHIYYIKHAAIINSNVLYFHDELHVDQINIITAVHASTHFFQVIKEQYGDLHYHKTQGAICVLEF